MIIAIVAIARNFALGRDGSLPWHYPADLRFFKRTTSGHPIVMGFKTWESIGRALPNRRNIVLSRTRSIDRVSGAEVIRSREEIVRIAATEDVYIIGGGQIYNAFGDFIDRWIVTEVPVSVEDADVFMRPDFLAGFAERSSEDIGDRLIVRTFERADRFDVKNIA